MTPAYAGDAAQHRKNCVTYGKRILLRSSVTSSVIAENLSSELDSDNEFDKLVMLIPLTKRKIA